jgi:plasmid maintenance system antidote protein VapI
MARPKSAFPVDDAWRRRVRRALEERGLDQLGLAKAVKCSPSLISELLSGKTHSSEYVTDIHTTFGWTPPMPPTLPDDTQELVDLWQDLSDLDKGRVLERVRMLVEAAKKPK